MCTENFQVYKLDVEKAVEAEIKLPTLVGSQKKQRNSRKTSTSASLTMLKPLTVWITTNCRKILKEMGIPDHLTCLLRNLYAGQDTNLELDVEQQTGSKLGKEYVKVVYCHYAEPDEAQAGIKIARRNINNLMYADDSTLMGEREEELKSLLLR